MLLLILVDTVNLVDMVNLRLEHRCTMALDVSAAEFLISQVCMTDTAFSLNAYYMSIQKVCMQVTHLSTTNLLCKDYTEWMTSNNSESGSVPYHAAWVEWEGGVNRLVNGVQEFVKERELDLAVVMMGFDKEWGFKRELVVVVMEERLSQVVVEELEGEGGKMLEVSLLEGSEGVYRQGVAVGEEVGGESLNRILSVTSPICISLKAIDILGINMEELTIIIQTFEKFIS
ncbi:LOW QUALITY PROTEIN: hypothetical protein BC936DRAFT_139257 [Jimgerdemannia flammicorona]|uniref:DHHA2 domain-containing protein n=1 Tax=Jimgerdemannia flammicorona TaxID=994334 RepID=A0A433BAA7_9FUNG|nr:LOW QUALITY PROTEIN: hypothetical protein BC936DRAFT_139257 [Jimgerdemannia flammicorona]